MKNIRDLFKYYKHDASEFATKSFSTLTFALLTLGFKESQQPRSNSGNSSTVSNILFERMDKSIPHSGMKNLYVPRVNSEGLFSLLRGTLYRSALKINRPLMESIVPPNDQEDRRLASTHEGLRRQWGKFALIRRIFSKIQGKGNRAPVVNAGQVYTLKGAFPFVSPQFFN